jgi:hypothetical protein
MDVSHAILFLENADFVRITGLYFPAKFEYIIKGFIVLWFRRAFYYANQQGCNHERNVFKSFAM